MVMSEKLLSILCERSCGNKNQALDPLLEELIDVYINDPNSSTLREQITCKLSGYRPLDGKHGRDCIDEQTGTEKEIKPKSFTKNPTNGSSCFNDYTRKRFVEDKEQNLSIIHSFFVDDRIQYIVEFSFDAVADKLDEQIYEKCELNKNDYVRSASWNYKQWLSHDSLKFLYFDREQIENNNVSKKTLTGPFKKLLIERYEQSTR